MFKLEATMMLDSMGSHARAQCQHTSSLMVADPAQGAGGCTSIQCAAGCKYRSLTSDHDAKDCESASPSDNDAIDRECASPSASATAGVARALVTLASAGANLDVT